MKGCYESATLWNASGNGYVRHILPVKCRWTKSGAVIPLSQSYLDPNLWDALDHTDKRLFFTLRKGDLLVAGEKYDEVADRSGRRLNDILLKYMPAAFFIDEVSDRSRAVCGAHFFVCGG